MVNNKCFKCGNEYLDGDIYCHSCGEKLRNDKYIFSKDNKVYGKVFNKDKIKEYNKNGLLLIIASIILSILSWLYSGTLVDIYLSERIEMSLCFPVPIFLIGLYYIIHKSYKLEFIEDSEIDLKKKENKKTNSYKPLYIRYVIIRIVILLLLMSSIILYVAFVLGVIQCGYWIVTCPDSNFY